VNWRNRWGLHHPRTAPRRGGESLAGRNESVMFVAGTSPSVQYEEISRHELVMPLCSLGLAALASCSGRAAKAFHSKAPRLKSLVMFGTATIPRKSSYTRFVCHELSTTPAFTLPESITPGCNLTEHNYSGTRHPCVWLQSIFWSVHTYSPISILTRHGLLIESRLVGCGTSRLRWTELCSAWLLSSSITSRIPHSAHGGSSKS